MKAGERPLLQRAFHPSQTGPLDTFEESFSSCICGDGTRYVKTCSFPNPDRVVFLAFTYPRFISFFKLVIFGTNRLSRDYESDSADGKGFCSKSCNLPKRKVIPSDGRGVITSCLSSAGHLYGVLSLQHSCLFLWTSEVESRRCDLLLLALLHNQEHCRRREQR